MKSLDITEQNAAFRFEDAYEVIREAVQAFMALEGYKPYSHEATVSFGYDKKLLSEPESNSFDRYRQIRNDITYKGKNTTKEEAKEIISFAEITLKILEKKFKDPTATTSCDSQALQASN